jgi:AcrR family transcriptional regulator
MAKKRVRRSKEESRELILGHAIGLFSKRGFTETSFQHIADACEVSHSAVLHHFGSKLELARECARFVLGHNREFVDRGLTPELDALARTRAHFARNLAWAEKHPAHAQMLILYYYLASVDAEASTAYTDLLEIARERVRSLLLAAQREKLIAQDLALREVVHALYDALLGSFVNLVSTRKRGAKAVDLEAKWEVILRSLLRPRAPSRNL